METKSPQLRLIQSIVYALCSEMEVMTDRLAELRADKDTSIDLEDEDGDCTVVSPALIDGFLQTVNQMNRNLERLQQNLDEMRQIQENVRESSALKKRYQEVTNEIKQISLNIYKGLKSLSKEITNELRSNRHNAEFRIKKAQEAALRQKLKRLVLEYQQLEEQNKEKYRGMLRRQLQIVGIHYTSISDDRFEELVSQIESGIALTQEDILKQTNQERQTLKEVEARKISELEKNVKELHDMFHEMTVLLNDESQDENDFIADNIEHNVENTKDYVPKATKDYVPEVTEPIEIARNYPKKTSLKWMMCGIATIVIAIFLLIITLPVALVIIIIIIIIVSIAVGIGSCRHQETQDN
ncbi:PREDICTED: syntaxin-1A-like isoform X1 [Amphimedon queenslandica]|uniref:Syntaxin N-terminal domain-containing protein n=2 Tax=Amphimedon queenslandica TaxID=400682 RepID=A0A1X7UGW8_AMPQE|nr:PREDICTED: syntaxin-1A-like isoform X1 [Amphimedon queenslandica]|eukprot:XP_019854137.1 PREDICTED: syntaxin-1A-like isoform X1 [Amphimedon queenslandica]